jgi:DsbC/DsbD-like thiol-disulfide interchange protein
MVQLLLPVQLQAQQLPGPIWLAMCWVLVLISCTVVLRMPMAQQTALSTCSTSCIPTQTGFGFLVVLTSKEQQGRCSALQVTLPVLHSMPQGMQAMQQSTVSSTQGRMLHTGQRQPCTGATLM